METARERFFATNTMILLLKVLEGKRTTIELHNEKEVTGRVVTVDGFMNITMANVTFRSSTQPTKRFDQFFVSGKTIRYVHIPDEINMKTAMEGKLKQYSMRAVNDVQVKEEIKEKAWQKMKKTHDQQRARERKQEKGMMIKKEEKDG